MQLIEVEIMVDDKFRELSVSGADLGFGDGPGTFHGRLTTDYFNGVVWQPKVFQHSLIDIALGATTGGIEGFAYFEKSFITFNVIPADANPADLNDDGVVGPADLAELLASWGHCVGCPADLNHDGAVGPADLAQLLANWG